MVVPGAEVEIDFDIIREVWSSYDLEDGTLLRSRTILTKVLGPRDMPPKGSQVALGFSFQQINTITSPRQLRGTPNPTPMPVGELQRLPIEEVEVVTEREAWNLYRIRRPPLPQGLKTKVVVSSVFRVPSQFDQEGNPMYVINSTTIVTPARTKELQER